MATRDRYVRILVGFGERLREAGLSLEAIGLVFLIYTLSLKRSIPGCLRIGVGGLAEALGFAVGKTERLLKEHERQGTVRVDRKARLIYIVGAVEADGPRTKQSVVAFYRDWRELPDCPVKTEIAAAIVAVLNQSDESLQIEWDRQLKSCGETHANSYAESYDNASVTPIPTPKPPSEIRDPSTQQPPPAASDLAPYLAAFERLGWPFDYAAAAARLSDNQKERLLAIDLQSDLGPALQGLRTSFWAGDRGKARPTLHDLIVKASLRQDLREGKHEEVGKRWTCALCALSHPIVDPCPPECDDCHRRHDADQVCAARRLRLDREAAEAAEQAADEREKADAEAQGLTVEALRAQREEAQRAQRRAWLADFKKRSTEAA